METITMCNGAASGVAPIIFFRLEDGEQTFYHSTGIAARPEEAERNLRLRSQLEHHKLAMCKAYTMMQLKRMDMNSRIFEMMVGRVMTECIGFNQRKSGEPVYQRLMQYLKEAHRDGVIGQGRYIVLIGKARKLQRFLIIKGLSGISAGDFTADLLLEYRKFIYDEYHYVSRFPELYPKGEGRHAPRRRCKDTTVVHDLKTLQAFFRELEDTGEIRQSPFKKISFEKRRSIMHVMYDAPIFLKADELRRVMQTAVPPELQQTKDIFVLNCALGCRISDLKRLTMDKVAVSEEGIPYVHYIPSKTARLLAMNQEIQTPLITSALEIVQRTRLAFNGHNPKYEKQVYNKNLRRLLEFCGIDRRVCLYDSERGDNIYKPLYEVASSKLARKTHVDMLTKVQINYYAAGLHREGSGAVFRYTSLELKDRYTLLLTAFGEADCRATEHNPCV
jgi:integrase